MNDNLTKTCETFLYNKSIIENTSRLISAFNTDTYFSAIGAYYFMAQKTEANEEMIKLCRQIIKENNGIFSSFRGTGEPIFACILAADKDPGTKMALALAAYDALRRFFSFSPFLPYLALIMTDIVTPDSYNLIALNTEEIYNSMRASHIFLTNNEDIPYAGLFAMNKRQNEELLLESETIYSILADNFSLFSRNALQTVSHALTLCIGEPRQKCTNFFNLYDKVKDVGLKYSHSFDLIALSILANLGLDLDTITEDLLDVTDYLKSRYSFFSGAKRRQHAIMICAAHYMNTNIELTSAIVVSSLLEIIQQQNAAAAAA